MDTTFFGFPALNLIDLIYEMVYNPSYRFLGQIRFKFIHNDLEKHLEYTLLQIKRNAEQVARLKKIDNKMIGTDPVEPEPKRV